jgi:hypothetical protein
VIAAVAKERARPAPRATGLAADGRDRLNDGEQLGQIVSVGAGEKASERDARGVRDQMVFAARFAPVDRAGAGFGAPKTAGT